MAIININSGEGPSKLSDIAIELVHRADPASQPLISAHAVHRRGSCLEATVTVVAAISGLATAVSAILSKTESYNPSHANNAKYCGIVWAVSVGAGALLSLKTRTFKPLLLAVGGPITGAIGACCLACAYFTQSA